MCAKGPKLTHYPSGPAQLLEPRVGHPEVMTDLVEHGRAHLRREVGFVAGARTQRPREDGDPIREDPAVAHRVAPGERDAFVEPEQGAVPGAELLAGPPPQT